MAANSCVYKVNHHQATLRDNSMKACFLFGPILSVVAGCTSSYDVANESSPDKYSFAQVNEDAKDQSFTISTVHGEEIDATDLFIGADSASFLEPSVLYTDKRSTIPTSSVETITMRRADWVAGAEGFGIGFLSGAMLGVLLASGGNGDTPLIEGSVGVGAVTGFLGAIVGVIVGHKYEYQFANKADSVKK